MPKEGKLEAGLGYSAIFCPQIKQRKDRMILINALLENWSISEFISL